MQWIIQSKFDHDVKVSEIKDNLKRFGIPYTNCSVIPFSTDGIVFEDGKTYSDFEDDFVFIYGSYTLANIAKTHFNPGAYVSPNLAIDKLFNHYKDEMFNHDMVISTIKDAPIIGDYFFVRPTEDTKSFCGTVMTKDDFENMQEKIVGLYDESTYATITPNTMISIAPLRNIYQEVRCFVVDRKIATYSQYRLGGRVEMSEYVDPDVIAYAANIAAQEWQPDVAYCLDIAVGDLGPKILETNCINSSGLYKIDTQKLVNAIDILSLNHNK